MTNEKSQLDGLIEYAETAMADGYPYEVIGDDLALTVKALRAYKASQVEPKAPLVSLKEGDLITTVSPAEEPSLTLNGYQLKEALEFVAPDGEADQLETDVTIQWGEGHCGPGHYVSLTEYPDEGSILLAGDPPESPLNRDGES